MISGFVGKQIRRTNRNLVVANVIVVAIVVVIALCAHSYFAECFRGPFPTTIEEVGRLNSPSDAPHEFVTLPLDSTRFENFAYSLTGGSNHQDDYYFFYRLKDGRYLVVDTHSKTLPETFTGAVAGTKGDIEDRVLPGVGNDLHGSIAAVSLDGANYRSTMYLFFAVAIPALLLAFWNFFRVVRRMGNPLRHPIAKELAKIGPPEEMAVAVDAEIQAGAQKVKRVLLTTSWLAHQRLYTTDLVYLGDIAWAYKQETKHKQYGITVNTTYSTVIHDVRGKKLTIPLSKQQVETLVAELAAKVPWAYVGFDPRLKQAWEKGRGELLASIEQRKQRALGAVPPVE